MKIGGIKSGGLAIGVLLMSAVLAGATGAARAGLGGGAGAIESDAAALGGKFAETPATAATQPTGYVSRSFVTASGVTVREYVANSGPVFGVAWQGQRPPDLRVLLGSYYDEYAAASAARKRPVDLRHASIEGPNVTVFLHGRMGYSAGRAYVSSLVPAGVDPGAVVK